MTNCIPLYTAILLSWSTTDTNISCYEIQTSTKINTNFLVVSTNFLRTNLLGGYRYDFGITAVNLLGLTSTPSWISYTSPTPNVIIYSQEILTSTNNGKTWARDSVLSWTNCPCEEVAIFRPGASTIVNPLSDTNLYPRLATTNHPHLINNIPLPPIP
jgi:hypothetical protein